jgi:hypothetical protein
MIVVSSAWKEAQRERLLPEMHIEITYNVTEPGLQLDASSSATLQEAFSQADWLTSTADRHPEKYATLEHGIWGLDGSFEYFDGSPIDPGYVTTEMASAESLYGALPTITITMGEVHTGLIPGITVVWSEAFNEWAKSFRVTAYNGSSVVAQKLVDNNTDVASRVWMDMANYNKIVIEVLEWSHPYHRARATEVFLGIRNIYTKNDLMSFKHSQSADLLSAVLPKNEIEFKLRNEDARWNPDNPDGAERYLLERQEIELRYGLKTTDEIEWVDGGHFWLSGWHTPANGIEATFTARDALEFASAKYTGPTSGTLYDIAYAAFEQADIPNMADGSQRYAIHDVLREYTTTFTEEATIAEVLQMVAHAAGCVLYQNSKGIIQISPWGASESDYRIDGNVSYAYPEFDISKPLKAVVVSYGENQEATVQVGSSGEVQTVDNEFITTEADARRVAHHTANVLKGRKTVSGEYRADVRLEALDTVTVQSKYAENRVAITDIEYSTTGGAFKGKYSGRVVE